MSSYHYAHQETTEGGAAQSKEEQTEGKRVKDHPICLQQ